MDMKDPAIRPRRLAVSGGSVITAETAQFCGVLGRLLAAQPGLVVVTGGFKCLRESPRCQSADWATADAVVRELERRGLPIEEHVETMLPEEQRDWSGAERFRYGKVVILQNRSLQARRFCLVNTTDATVTISGGKGTSQIIDLALAILKPVLPLPFTGGKSRRRWDQNRDEIMQWFGIGEEVAGRMEATRLQPEGEDMVGIAQVVVDHLIPALRRKCFVAMPYSDDFHHTYTGAVLPAIRACGFREVRADQLEMTGNALDVLRQGILFCDVLVADISGSNPNVMYELGLSHAQNKPTVLICRTNAAGDLPKLPFDVLHERVIGYDADMSVLREKINRALRHVFPSFGSEA